MTNETGNRKPLLVTLPIRIKGYDIDFVGHVNNIVYIRWLEDLRLFLLDTYLPLDGLIASGVAPVVVNTEIHYRQGIVLADRDVTARMWVTDFGRATFFLGAEFAVGDDVRCTATQRGTFLGLDSGRPVRVPEPLKEKFRAELGA